MSGAKIFGMILSGGSGTRLWPLSRENFPKQFLNLYGDKTLLQHTAERLLKIISPEYLRVIAGSRWNELVKEQLRNFNLAENFIIQEPCARGTAPAILLAVDEILKAGATRDDIVIITPSDGAITNVEVFTDALKIAVEAAQKDFIAALGIEPTRPDTGFGYIKRGKKFSEGFYEAEKFVEKPDLKTALNYYQSRAYFWNGGIFIFKISSLFRELERADEDLYKIFTSGNLKCDFETVKNISFDNALMEKAERVAFVPLINSGWSDVGSWDALHDILPHDENNNTFKGDVINLNGHNNYIYASKKLVVLNNVDDLVFVDAPEAIFITKRGNSQDVRNVVKYLKENGRKDKL